MSSKAVLIRPSRLCIPPSLPPLFQLAPVLARQADQTAQLTLSQSLERPWLPLLNLSVACRKFGRSCVLVAVLVCAAATREVGVARCAGSVKRANIVRCETRCEKVTRTIEVCSSARCCVGGRGGVRVVWGREIVLVGQQLRVRFRGNRDPRAVRIELPARVLGSVAGRVCLFGICVRIRVGYGGCC